MELVLCIGILRSHSDHDRSNYLPTFKKLGDRNPLTGIPLTVLFYTRKIETGTRFGDTYHLQVP